MNNKLFENIGGNKFKMSFNEATSEATLKANERKAINNEIHKHNIYMLPFVLHYYPKI
jgi:hypothetical protein